MKYFSKMKDVIVRFSKKGLSSKEIAIAISVGTFIAFIPIIGVHTLTALVFAYIFRLNTLFVVFGTQISNPVSYPFQLLISAEVGSLILRGNFLEMKFSRDIDYLNHYILPIIVGSLVLATIVSGLSYVLIKNILRKRSRFSA